MAEVLLPYTHEKSLGETSVTHMEDTVDAQPSDTISEVFESYWIRYYNYFCRYLQPQYRNVGDEEAPVLGSLERELYNHPLAGSFIEEEDGLINFLNLFFVPSVVSRVEETFQVMRDSLLGIEYTKRGLYSTVASTLIFDLCNEARIHATEASGTSSNEDGGGHRKGKIPHAGPEDGTGSSRGGGEGGEGGGARSGEGGGAEEQQEIPEEPEDIFSTVPIRDVTMPLWNTPEKKGRLTVPQMRIFTSTIRERTTEFAAHPIVRELKSLTRGGLDFLGLKDEYVYLFHGSRTEHLLEFQRVGISPTYVRNELSPEAAFYVTDSIEFAYEHPMHKHPGAGANSDRKNFILIFAFRVNSRILAGNVAPDFHQSPFKVKTFLTSDDSEWARFCVNNLNQVRVKTRDKYDIVMGPVCTPRFNVIGGEKVCHHVTLLTWGSESSRWFKQVAFASDRARQWLQKHLVCTLRENRSD